MSSSSGSSSRSTNYGFGVGLAGAASTAVAQQGQGVAALLVMLAVLCFIFAYCCWGAPFCRSLCRRHCCCRLEDTDSDSGGFAPSSGAAATDQAMLATPTIILLPHGRMLVVDGTIFTQLQAENTGLDLVELGESVMRAQRNPSVVTRHQLQNSQGSIIEMDAETPSKDSMGSLGCFPPPTYESIYGKEEAGDMPPSYSDILLHRFANLPFEIEMQEYGRDNKDIEMRSLENCPHIIGNPINNLTYPYGATASTAAAAEGATTNYSSQSLPRNGSVRNPSLISNPLDNYYVDNELAGLYQSQRRTSATSSGIRRTRHNSYHHEFDDVHNTRTNADDQFESEMVEDNRFAHTWDQASRSQNEAMNSRNNARSDSRRCEPSDDLPRRNAVYVRSRRSLGSVEDVPIRHHRETRISSDQINWDLNNLDVRYTSDEERPESSSSRHDTDEVNVDDDPNNFKALADIRESRV